MALILLCRRTWRRGRRWSESENDNPVVILSEPKRVEGSCWSYREATRSLPFKGISLGHRLRSRWRHFDKKHKVSTITYSLLPTPYSLLPTPYSLQPITIPCNFSRDCVVGKNIMNMLVDFFGVLFLYVQILCFRHSVRSVIVNTHSQRYVAPPAFCHLSAFHQNVVLCVFASVQFVCMVLVRGVGRLSLSLLFVLYRFTRTHL